jgi:hypothetical protein
MRFFSKKTFLSIVLLSVIIPFSSVFSFQVKEVGKTEEEGKVVEKKGAFFDGLLPSESADSDISEKIKMGTISLNDIPIILLRLIDLFTKIAATIAVTMILWGGVQYIFSGITEEKESAKNTLKYSIIGLFVTFWSWIAVNMLQIHLTT